jgi:glycyl-tRNA synthetase
VPSPATGEPGSLTPARNFNMMFETYVGALREESEKAYLRPETAQGMFADFKAVLDTGRVKIPFGIAQIGKSFRNEITPRNFIFRSREFEQMEMEFFISDDDDWAKWHRYWIDWCRNWLLSIGPAAENLSEYNHPRRSSPFTRRARPTSCSEYPFGVQELGASPRAAVTTSASTQSFQRQVDGVFRRRKEGEIRPARHRAVRGRGPHRLAIFCSAYAEETTTDEKGQTETRVVMRFAPRIAPIKVAVFPLLRNKPPLVEKAREVFKLSNRISPPSGTTAATSANATAIRTNKAPRGA